MSPYPGLAGEIIALAEDLVGLWREQQIAGLPRAERNAAIAVTRARLIDAVTRLQALRDSA